MSLSTYIVEDEEAKTVSAVVKAQFRLSSRDVQSLFRKRQVRVNRRVAHSSRTVTKGDVITLQLPRDKDYRIDIERGPLEILYEDNNTLVVNKPPFMLVHPAGRTKSGTLSNLVAGYYADRGIVHKIRPVHRLDRDTSGCILFGKTKEAQRYYSEELTSGKIKRIYRCIVDGVLSGDGIIDAPVGIDTRSDNRRAVLAGGQEARTAYRVLEAGLNTTAVECRLVTGRTHQIRVHMAHIGHPVVGDAMYGHRKAPYTRQCLHAYRIQFTPYRSDRMVEVTAEIPPDFGCEPYKDNEKRTP